MKTQADSLLELRRFIVPEFVFGVGAIELIGQYAAKLGAKKVLLVTDSGVTNAGWVSVVEKSLQKSSLEFVVFDKVTPNPKDYEVMTGAEFYKKQHCDVIVAVGGGSPMDCAKGIGIVSTNNRSIINFKGVNEVTFPGPPLICIPTTAGTSADISQFDIIMDTLQKVKIAIISKMVIPDVSLIDPQTTSTMPAELTAATGLDVLTHAIESYVSNASSPVTDLQALESIRLVSRNLLNAVERPNDIEVRTNMMLASLLAGLAFSNASLGMVHAMAHSLGGLLDLPHGECNAILLEHVCAFNFKYVPERYRYILQALGVETKSFSDSDVRTVLLETLSSLRESVGIKKRLSSMGLISEDIPLLAETAYKDPCLATNPHPASVKEIIRCYKDAY